MDILETFLAPAGLSADSPRPPSLLLEPEDVLLLVFVWLSLIEFLMSEVFTVILFILGRLVILEVFAFFVLLDLLKKKCMQNKRT